MGADRLLSYFSVLFILICAGIPQTSQATCPIFGTDLPSNGLSRSREERIFLNFNAPAQCRGNVTSWRFCFYCTGDFDGNRCDDDDDFNSNSQFGAKFVIYRRESPTSDNYLQVVGSVREEIVLYQNINSRFQCMDEILEPQNQFEIQENDILAACIWDKSSVNPLYLVSDSGSNQHLYQVDRNGYNDCTDTQLSSVDISHNRFRNKVNYELHLFANINISTACRAGNNPPPSQPRTSSLSGTFLNTQHSAMCSDHLTKWNYCYYTTGLDTGTTYSMTVAVWRPNSINNTYALLQSSVHTITLQHNSTLAKVFCMEEVLSPSEYVQVAQGDIIGVVLPSNNPIPVVASNSDPSFSLRRSVQQVTAISVFDSALSTESDNALHLYATLEYVPEPTTSTTEISSQTIDVQNTTEISSTTSPTTSSQGMNDTSQTTGVENTTTSPTTSCQGMNDTSQTTEVSTTAAIIETTSFAPIGVSSYNPVPIIVGVLLGVIALLLLILLIVIILVLVKRNASSGGGDIKSKKNEPEYMYVDTMGMPQTTPSDVAQAAQTTPSDVGEAVYEEIIETSTPITVQENVAYHTVLQ